MDYQLGRILLLSFANLLGIQRLIPSYYCNWELGEGICTVIVIKPVACWSVPVCAWFLKIDSVRTSVYFCVCVCVCMRTCVHVCACVHP